MAFFQCVTKAGRKPGSPLPAGSILRSIGTVGSDSHTALSSREFVTLSVFHPCGLLNQHLASDRSSALPFVIPSEVEGSAVTLSQPQNNRKATALPFVIPTGGMRRPC